MTNLEVPRDADRQALEEQREFFLRSLRDLDEERAAGDIDDLDYYGLKDDYTVRAAEVLRALDELDQPAVRQNETVAAPTVASPTRRRWRRPVAVAVVALVVAGLASWAVVSASGTRVPGQTISGAAVGPEAVDQRLLAAQKATARGDGVSAIKDYEAILKTDPNQLQALTGEGWILAQTRQPDLLAQGIGLLTRALVDQPGFELARLYRGIALIAAGQQARAVPDLRYYLAHGPDPTLVAKVRQALTQAERG